VSNKVLIIGGTGYLGKLLTSSLKQCELNVFTAGTSEVANFKTNILSKDSLTSIFKNNNFDIIINLAGYGLNSTQNIKSLFEINSTGTKILAECAIKWLPNVHVIHTATSIDNSVNKSFESDYAKSKSIGSKIMEDFMLRFPQNFSILRLNNIYGPSQPKNRLFMGVVSSILNKKYMTINFPNRKRDFCLDSDVVSNIVEFIKAKKISGSIIEIGTGSSISVRTFATEICSQLNVDLNLIKFNTSEDDFFENLPLREPSVLFKKCHTDYSRGIEKVLRLI
jgi:nucleoside-diphosphate-sugar epimerase